MSLSSHIYSPIYQVNEMKTKLPSYAQPLFIRFVSSIDATGTFKFKKNALKEDG